MERNELLNSFLWGKPNLVIVNKSGLLVCLFVYIVGYCLFCCGMTAFHHKLKDDKKEGVQEEYMELDPQKFMDKILLCLFVCT